MSDDIRIHLGDDDITDTVDEVAVTRGVSLSGARPAEHAPARIFGGQGGRRIWCECGAELGPTWEPVVDVMAEHIQHETQDAA